MARKKMWVEYPDDGELSGDRDTPGAKSALVRDADNKLITHAKLYDDEDYDDDASVTGSTGSDVDAGGLVLGLLGVAGLVAVAVVGASRRRQDRAHELPAEPLGSMDASASTVATPPVSAPAGWYDVGQDRLRWWDGQAWTEHVHVGNPRVGAPAGWYDDGSGRERWWDGHMWTGVFQPLHTTVTRSPEPHTWEQRSHSVVSPSPGSITMTKAEWQERVRTMIIARSISEMQWRSLSQARIEDADAELLMWQAELQKLTPQQFSAQLDRTLAADPGLNSQVVSAATPGWYDDGSGYQRWWNGQAWTDAAEFAPNAVQPRAIAQRGALAEPLPSTPAGWYNDGAGRQRWWDGQRWTEYYA
ncbi:DUF2510 domain-containing protein [Tessaracoccus defluvii]|uniref:DUF2510 domain-containing protein n=1 Tax=Tessaracoccus defluvii TaxID=1285901 RepID=UPI001D05BBBE|nr:DUF2510 domain-containing protein [Tessaracoccus defluvii]